MAAALLGKSVGLLALVVLFYTCCYGFRIRDAPPQSPLAEQTNRGECRSIFGGCTEKTATTTTVPRRWHETGIPRTASSRKPPVEVTSSDDDDHWTGDARPRFERTGHSKEQFGSSTKTLGTKSVEVSEDDEDEDALVEVEGESVEEEIIESEELVLEDVDDEEDEEEEEEEDADDDEDDEDDDADDDEEEDDDDDDEEGKDREKVKVLKDEGIGVKRKSTEKEDEFKSKETKRSIRGIDEARLKTTKVDYLPKKAIKDTKPSRIRDSEEIEEEDEEKEDRSKISKQAILPRKQNKEKEDQDTGKSKEREKDDKSADDEEDEETDEEEEVSEPEVSTPPPRKLEKVRHADKDKIKHVETVASPPVTDKTKVTVKKSIETTKKQEATVKKEVDVPKEIEKPGKEDEPRKNVKEIAKKPAEGLKKSADIKEKQAESTKKVESPTVTKAGSETSKSKSPSKPEERVKDSVKPEAPKVPSQSKDQAKQPEKSKVRTVDVKVPSKKSAELSQPDKKESKSKTKRGAQAPITLPELNAAILHVPTFVPNFTAVQGLECQQHGKIFLRQLRGYKLWALQMLDSGAKVPSGLLRGNVNQLGDFDECLGVMAHVKVDDKTIKVQGKYCLANIDLHATHPDMKLPVNLMQARAFIRGNMREPGHFVPKFTTVNWALCLPAACSAEDAQNILETALAEYNATAGIRFTVDVDPDMCYVKQRSRSYTKETIGVMYFYAMIICLVAVATIRDYLVVSERKGNYSERIIMSFSLRKTVKALLKEGRSQADIKCIHGIRTFVTIALYIAHQLLPISRLPFANRVQLTEISNNPLSSIIRVAAIYTDAFLLLSGVLSAYNMANEFTIRGEIRWFCRFIARYIRLTPALIVVVFWYAFIMEHTGSGPQWNAVIKANAELCKNNAWTNLLYVQNFFPLEEMCATHTHQLALDMQLSLLAPILVFFLQCRPIIGILLISFMVLLSATLRYIATINNYLSVVIFHGMSIKHLYKTANLTYILPLHRATPYVLGVGLGVLLHYTGRNVKLNKVLVILGWLISVALGSWSLFSPWRLARRDYAYDAEEAAHYAVISPVVWSFALCWFIFACFTNNGGIINRFLSSYWLVVFSKISYAVYLTQFPVFFYNVGTTRYSTEFQLHRAIDPLEAAVVIAVSTVLTLLFDVPMQEVKNVIMESTDNLVSEIPTEAKVAAEDEKKADKRIGEEAIRGKAFEEDEVASTGWDWQTDIMGGGGKIRTEILEDEESVNVPILWKSNGRRKSLIAHDTYEGEAMPTWDWIKGPNKRSSKGDVEFVEREGNGKNGERDYPNVSGDESSEFSRMQQEHEEALRRSRRSLSRSLDNKRLSTRDGGDEEEYLRRREEDDDPRQHRRSQSRGRSMAREQDDYRSWEFVGKERPPSRGPDSKRPSSSLDDPEPKQRQARSSLSMPIDTRRTFSSESEDEPSLQRKKAEKKSVTVEPRISDEEDWENELRIRRKQFMEKLAMQQRGSMEEEEDLSSVKRRSSAEGKIALLKDPSGDDNMDSWTISVGPRIAQLGSSQEPSEPEEDGSYIRRKEYRERGPPLREEISSEGETTWDSSRRRSYSSSQLTSMEEDEDVGSFNFILTKDSKRISLQDLSKLSQEESDLANSGWNVVKKEGSESVPKTTSLGLFKRESIVKSQASEEDPEYLLPERPKLVQQEREHPFKKAWQMQKSRSEEDRSSAYVIKETRERQSESKSKDEDSPSIRRELSGEQSEDIGSFADDESESITLSRSRSTDTSGNRTSKSGTDETDESSTRRSKSTDIEDSKATSKSGTDEESAKFNWPNEDEQFEAPRSGQRSKSEETDWKWENET